MKLISLSQGQWAIVDDADYDLVSQYKWCALYHPINGMFRAVRTVRENGKKRTIWMHRFLLGNPNSWIDHENRNSLDNRRSNLRVATPTQNHANKCVKQTSKSGFKCVHWNKKIKRWIAYITLSGKRKHLGCFDDSKEAAKAYDQAAISCWGDFALTNQQMGLL